MPQQTVKIPSYRHHKGSGQAFVQVRSKRYYLGKYGSSKSRERYRRFLAELEAAAVPEAAASQQRRSPIRPHSITLVEMTAAYRRFAQGYYRKNGEPTGHLHQVWRATEILADLYGRTDAEAFGPSGLRAIQQKLVKENKARSYINDICGTIRRLFKWAVAQELVKVAVYQALCAVDGLRLGRTKAREPEPIGPVSDAVVDATLPHLPPVVADMVRFQRLVGCRPCEVCIIRPCDVDATGPVWSYTPTEHKTEHHGRDRKIFIGPKAQDVLRPYLLREKTAFCFVPADSEKKRHRQQRENRKSNVPPSQAKRKPKRFPKRKPGDRYDTSGYRRAITRACAIADAKAHKDKPEEPADRMLVPCWRPNQLRHSVATTIRQQFGVEAAQVVLGHSDAVITQVYAERDYSLAERIMREIG